MSNLEKYGFKPHGAEENSGSTDTEKTVSCKVGPEVWGRWKRAQQRLSAYGEIQLAAVVRSAFLNAGAGIRCRVFRKQLTTSAGNR